MYFECVTQLFRSKKAAQDLERYLKAPKAKLFARLALSALAASAHPAISSIIILEFL